MFENKGVAVRASNAGRQLPSPPTSQYEGRSSCYIERASLEDVMFDQLEWLLEHASSSCARKCPHCMRLEPVKDLLLVPFEAPIEPLAAPVGTTNCNKVEG